MEEVKNYYAGRHLISMEEDIVLVCRKSKISMQEGREVEGKSVIRLILLNIDYCCRIRRMRVDGSRIRKEKVADSKISGYVLASHADVLRIVTRSSQRTFAQRTGHFRSLAISQSWGAFYSTKYSGLKFRVFHATNGTVF